MASVGGTREEEEEEAESGDGANCWHEANKKGCQTDRRSQTLNVLMFFSTSGTESPGSSSPDAF